MEKVKLPREVAEAIIYFRENVSIEYWEQALLKVAMEHERYIGNTEHCETIKEYVKSIDNLRLFMKALVNDFEVEETPEDKIRIEYQSQLGNPDIYCSGFRQGIEFALNKLSIKIEGVNT